MTDLILLPIEFLIAIIIFFIIVSRFGLNSGKIADLLLEENKKLQEQKASEIQPSIQANQFSSIPDVHFVEEQGSILTILDILLSQLPKDSTGLPIMPVDKIPLNLQDISAQEFVLLSNDGYIEEDKGSYFVSDKGRRLLISGIKQERKVLARALPREDELS